MHGQSGGAAAPSSTLTRLQVWRETNDGLVAFGGRVGVTEVQAVGRAGKVFMVDSGGYPAVYDYATKTLAIGGTQVMGGAGSIYGNLWAHSSGALFIDAKLTADSTYSCYRSTDEGVTWTKVLNYADFPATIYGSNTSPDSMIKRVECDNGWIIGAFYSGVGADDSHINRLIRSKDQGATWEFGIDIPPSYHPRHMHEVCWDPYRRVLWAAGGDSVIGYGVGCEILWSDDYGNTWHVFTGTRQTTGIIPTPSGVYVLIDDNANYVVEYYAGSSIGAVVAATKVQVFNPLAGHLPGLSVATDSGWSWWGWYDPDYQIVYCAYVGANGATWGHPSGAMLAGGYDGGHAWKMIDYTYSSTGATIAYAPTSTAVRPNCYDASWDGWHYTAPTYGGIARWRVRPCTEPIYVDWTAGTDYGAGTLAKPIKTIPDFQFPETRKIALLSNYATHAYLGSPVALVDRNGHTLGAAAGATVIDSQTMVGLGSDNPPTANWVETVLNGGNVTWNAAAPDSGTCVLSALTTSNASAAYAERRNLSLAQGAEAWCSFDVWIAEAALAVSTQLWELKAGVQLVVVAKTAAQNRDGVACNVATMYGLSSSIYYGDSLVQIPVPLQQWVSVLIRVIPHPTSGECDWWINGRKVGSVKGVQTAFAGTQTTIWFGGKNRGASATPRSIYYKNCKVGSGGNILATASYDLRAGSGIKVLPEGITA